MVEGKLTLVVAIGVFGIPLYLVSGLGFAGFVVYETNVIFLLVGKINPVYLAGESDVTQVNLGGERGAEVFLGKKAGRKLLFIFVVVVSKYFFTMGQTVIEVCLSHDLSS